VGAQGLSSLFDQVLDREGTHAEKHDARLRVFGRRSVIPLWLADTDFAAPLAITRALEQRARHPSYGYSLYPDSLFQALIHWYRQHHHWTISRDRILLSAGVVASLEVAVRAFTRAGQGVIIQPPVYPPFAAVTEKTGRRLVINPLRFDGEQYRMDFDHLEACARQPDTQLLLLCSPHNPVGRVWQRQELEQVLAIARRHGLVVLADEVHGDLIYPDRPGHTALATLANGDDGVVTAVSPGKSFNIQGMGLSSLISSRPDLHQRLAQTMTRLPEPPCNPFSVIAFETGYRQGGEWLVAMMAYVRDNRDLTMAFLGQQVPELKVMDPQGSYLLWLDCRQLLLDDAALKTFFVDQAGVGLSPGRQFGHQGSGFMRLNIATPRVTLQQALHQIHQAVAAHRHR